METKNSKQAHINLLRKCADECTINAQKCKEEGLDECARLCIACAAACHKALTDETTGDSVFTQCAEACSACAKECELHPYQHCMDCAEICRKCEVECRNMIGLKAGL